MNRGNPLIRFMQALTSLLVIAGWVMPAAAPAAQARRLQQEGPGFVFTPPAAPGPTTEDSGQVVFSVMLTQPPSAGSVNVAVLSSDPGEGQPDVTALTFDASTWNSPHPVIVTGQNDDVADGPQPYSIQLTASSDEAPEYVDVTGQYALSNADNDTAGVMVTPTSGLQTGENQATATFSVRLQSQPFENVTINLASSDTSEGTVSPASLTFTENTWDQNRTVTVTGVDDAIDDGDVSYNVVLEPASSADEAYEGYDPADVPVTNRDDDTAAINVTPASGLKTTEATGEPDVHSFTVVLGSEPMANVSIPVSSSDTTEGTASPASLTFNQANWDQPQTVTVTGVDDAIDDGDVSYNVVLEPASSADETYEGYDPADVPVINRDDDTAGVTINAQDTETSENGDTSTFSLQLNTQPTANVTISISSSDTGEGAIDPLNNPKIFTPSDWSNPQFVTVKGVDDILDDGDVVYNITFTVASAPGSTYQGISVPALAFTNLDDGSGGVIVTPSSGLATTESGGTAEFSVELTSKPRNDVTISISSESTGEATANRSSLKFTPDDWDVGKKVIVTGVDDDPPAADGDQEFRIRLGAPNSEDIDYSSLDAILVTGVNHDNDQAAIVVSPLTGLQTSEDGDQDVFTVSLQSKPKGIVTLAISSDPPEEGTVDPTSLEFTTEDWNTPQEITITGQDDNKADGDVHYQITVSVAATDEPSDPYKFADPVILDVINLDNDPPKPSDDAYTTAEDTPLTIPAPGVLVNDEPAGAALTAVLADNVVNGSLTLNANGSFTYTPAANYTGTDSFSYRVKDKAGVAYDQSTVKLEITPVNDPPQAVDDMYYTNQKLLQVTSGGVLKNDIDIDRDPLTAEWVSGAGVNLKADGTFSYTAAMTNTVNTFTYRAKDPLAASNPGQVTVIVESDAPNLAWQLPVSDGKMFVVPMGSLETITLQVQAEDDDLEPVIGLKYVSFLFWNPLLGEHGTYELLGYAFAPPYILALDAHKLNPGWNQIFAIAVDHAGNMSDYSQHRILIYVPYRILLPLTFR